MSDERIEAIRARCDEQTVNLGAFLRAVDAPAEVADLMIEDIKEKRFLLDQLAAVTRELDEARERREESVAMAEQLTIELAAAQARADAAEQEAGRLRELVSELEGYSCKTANEGCWSRIYIDISALAAQEEEA